MIETFVLLLWIVGGLYSVTALRKNNEEGVKVYTKHQDLTQASKHHKQMTMSYSPLRRVSASSSSSGSFSSSSSSPSSITMESQDRRQFIHVEGYEWRRRLPRKGTSRALRHDVGERQEV